MKATIKAPTKKELFDKYKDKSKEWLLEHYVSELKSKERLFEKCADYDDLMRHYGLKAHAADILSKQNECLKDILETNGIRPRQYVVSYIESDCKNCKHADYSKCWSEGEEPECGVEWNLDGSECEHKDVIETISFYAWKIEDDELKGITSEFLEYGYDIVSLMDINTGEVIYESKEGDGS